jgi:ABC-2 type transport system permease protein
MNSKQIIALVKKEMATYFTTPIAYIVISVFLILTGFLFFLFFFIYKQAELREFFNMLPIIFPLIIPAITMRLFAEERHSGSIEVLLTLPTSIRDIVTGKFLAATLFVVVMLFPTLTYAISIAFIGRLDIGPVVGGYFGAVMLAGAYVSVGVFASTLTKNQIVAFIIGLSICFLLTLLDKILFFLPGSVLNFVEYLGADFHFKNISRGVFDSRDFIYFFSVIGFALLGAIKVLEERR